MGARQRGRGRLAFSAASRLRKRINSSFSSTSAAASSCSRNMFSLASTGAPFSHTSATVASPSKHRVQLPVPPAGRAKRQRYQKSSASNRRAGESRLQSPASRSEPAAVLGTRVESQRGSALARVDGESQELAGVAQNSQPA